MPKNTQPLSEYVEARHYENDDEDYVELADRNSSFNITKEEFEALLVFAKKIGWL